VPEERQEVSIVARGTVETRDRAGVVRGLIEVAPSRVYKRETPRTAPDDGIRALCASVEGNEPLDRMHKLMDSVHERVTYVVGVTHAHTSAAEALKDGRGVCQDHAHIFISAARVMGLPARYVNGYFLTDSDEPSEAPGRRSGSMGSDGSGSMRPTGFAPRIATCVWPAVSIRPRPPPSAAPAAAARKRCLT